jgi:hypothetical protein
MLPSDDQTRFNTGLGSNGTASSSPNSTAASNDALDPVFRTNDGSNSPAADVSTPAARQAAYSMLLTRGDIRVGLPIPDGAEFELSAVDDPYRYASASELSLFRRPLPVTNVRFLTNVMWDGRQTARCATLTFDLGSQANDATIKHMKGTPLDDSARADVVFLERLIYFAQTTHVTAGPLDEAGARGGPANLAAQPFYVGMNAFPGPDPQGRRYTPDAFTLFDAWANIPGSDPHAAGRAAVARGEALFNTRSFDIKGVNGLNDMLGQETIQGTCTTCHNAPNLGSNSQGLLFSTGVSDGANRKPDFPLYTLRNLSSGATVTTTDPGAALVTGRWSDIGKFKVPGLRGVAARQPLFHDGSAATLADVIKFDDARFSIGLTDAEKSDLAAFLGAL